MGGLVGGACCGGGGGLRKLFVPSRNLLLRYASLGFSVVGADEIWVVEARRRAC